MDFSQLKQGPEEYKIPDNVSLCGKAVHNKSINCYPSSDKVFFGEINNKDLVEATVSASLKNKDKYGL